MFYNTNLRFSSNSVNKHVLSEVTIMSLNIINSDLTDLWICTDANKRISTIVSYIESIIGDREFNSKLLLSKVYKFHSEMTEKWKDSSYKKERLNNLYSSWLRWSVFSIDEEDIDNIRMILLKFSMEKV